MKRNRKKCVFVACAMCIALVLGVCVLYISKQSSNTEVSKVETQNLIIENEQDSQNENTETDSLEKNDDEMNVNNSSSEGSTEINQSSEVKGIGFPYSIPETNLEVTKINEYSGQYWEDGSDEEISGVSTILVKNTGKTDVEYAEINMKCNGKELIFTASVIPAGKSVVVQEKNKEKHINGTYTECYAEVAEVKGFAMNEESVSIDENEDGTLSVKNKTNKTIPCIRIFYKYYMEDENTYVGGITYNAKVIDLEGGETRKVMPKHYVGGYSQVVMVRTYDTKE